MTTAIQPRSCRASLFGNDPRYTVLLRFFRISLISVLASALLLQARPGLAAQAGNNLKSNVSHALDTRHRDAYGWVSCSGSFAPLGDGQAAALVVPAAEKRPGNTAANHYLPSKAELSAFLNNEKDLFGHGTVQENPYFAYVTGGFRGTTDEIIQWGAEKWGIPEDWLRAQYVLESYWRQSQLGDLTTVKNSLLYPAQSRVSAHEVYQSLGIAQVRWNHPDLNNDGIGTEPLRWKSTAFNVDYQAAKVRFYFDNPKGARSAWGDPSYRPCNNWLSIGGWYDPYPWNNSGQLSYVQAVQAILAKKTWKQPGF